MLPNSRSSQMKTLLSEAYKCNKVADVVNYVFNKSRFSDVVRYFSTTEKFDEYYRIVIKQAIDQVNKILYLDNKKFEWNNGKISICEIDKSPISNSFEKHIDSDYIKNLSGRITEDLENENFDSVVTKCRTLIEELCIYIIEKNNIIPVTDGKLSHLWRQTKVLLNMNDVIEFDKRVADLISGLNKIVDAIASLRNINSDAHGVGTRRINIGKREANLITNSTIIFCEYVYDVYSHQLQSKQSN